MFRIQPRSVEKLAAWCAEQPRNGIPQKTYGNLYPIFDCHMSLPNINRLQPRGVEKMAAWCAEQPRNGIPQKTYGNLHQLQPRGVQNSRVMVLPRKHMVICIPYLIAI